MKLRIIAIFIVSSFCFLTSNAPFASAQQQGITVSPSIVHLDLATDTPEYLLTYLNTTKANINLLLSVSDFSELEEGYKLNFLEAKDAQNYKYSLSSWISFENKTIQLAPNEKKTVKIFIDKDRITKGGHYASILAEIVQPEADKQVPLKAILSSLLFVRASTGAEIEDGKIVSLNPLRDGLTYPESFTLRFENSGNVHVIPHGTIDIYDPLGNFVARGIFNQDSLDALPESIRTYNTEVTNYQKVLVPGIYTVKAKLSFGKTNKKVYFETKFFSQGSFDFLKIALISAAIIILLFYLRKRYTKD